MTASKAIDGRSIRDLLPSRPVRTRLVVHYVDDTVSVDVARPVKITAIAPGYEIVEGGI